MPLSRRVECLPSYLGPVEASRRGHYLIPKSGTTHLAHIASYCRITESQILEFLSQNKPTSIFILIPERNAVQMLRSAKGELDLKVPSIY